MADSRHISMYVHFDKASSKLLVCYNLLDLVLCSL